MSVCTLRLVCPATAVVSLANRSCRSIIATERTLNRANGQIPKNQQRTFFNFPGIGSRSKNYARRELVGYSMEQMYAVVSDVANYNKFVPFCNRSVILSKGDRSMRADMAIGFPPVNERYTSHVTLSRPNLVRAECTDGRLFNHLLTTWRFGPGLPDDPRSCVVEFKVSFEFKSALHSQLANVFFDKIVLQMEAAFYKEASRRYGRARIPRQEIAPIKA